MNVTRTEQAFPFLSTLICLLSNMEEASALHFYSVRGEAQLQNGAAPPRRTELHKICTITGGASAIPVETRLGWHVVDIDVWV